MVPGVRLSVTHAAVLAAGGTDGGAPGFRAADSPRFYIGYLRDPQGNKIKLFSSYPDEPGRDDQRQRLNPCAP